MKFFVLAAILFSSFVSLNCQEKAKTFGNASKIIEFEQPKQVEIKGYDGIIMEPFISRDGNFLLFNNSNDPKVNTNLHWATKIDEFNFQYKGEIEGVNTESLEGVATLDKFNNLYFVSNRNYGETFSTIFKGAFVQGKVANIKQVDGFSKRKVLWVNFDVEVTSDGETLYLVDSEFDLRIVPKTGDLFVAKRNGDKFERAKNSDEIFKKINTNAIEYAVGISTDELEIYFNRVDSPISEKSIPEIYYATRTNKNVAFDSPRKLPNVTDFAEGATISDDGSIIYFHQKLSGKFALFGMKKRKM